jgi:hypothetical protein
MASVLVPAMLSLSTAQAADAVQWIDLPKKIGKGKMRTDGREDRQYRVVTKDGQIYAGYRLLFGPASVRLSDSGPQIPREKVTEIQIHRDGRLRDALFAPGGEAMALILKPVCGGDLDYCLPLLLFVPLLAPVALGVSAAAAPIVLPIQGIKRLLPDKVIKVAP